MFEYKVKFVPFIYRPWEKRILECISPARICCNILVFRVLYKGDSEAINSAKEDGILLFLIL